jgi:chromosome segregation ATPase
MSEGYDDPLARGERKKLEVSMSMSVVVEELQERLRFYRDRLDKACEDITSLQAENARLKGELESATEWNHSVAVCRDHTSQILVLDEADFCYVCELQKVESERDSALARLDECHKLRNALIRKLGGCNDIQQ